MNKYIVTGQVFLADGFDWEVDAPTRDAAEKIATRRAEDQKWPVAMVQEVCINNVELIAHEEDLSASAVAYYSLAQLQAAVVRLTQEIGTDTRHDDETMTVSVGEVRALLNHVAPKSH